MILYHAGRQGGRWYFGVRLKVRSEGKANVPRKGPFLLVMNHESNLDPLLVHAFCPRLLFTLTKSSAFRRALMRRFGPRTGAFPTRRYQVDPQAVRVALRLLAEDKGVGVFPEGSRSWDAALQSFRPGTVRLMLKAGVPVIPCAVTGTYEVWPRWGSMDWLKFGPGRPQVRIRYGEAIHLGRHDDRPSREAALPDATRRIREALRLLMEP